jgi:hypothetical protein
MTKVCCKCKIEKDIGSFSKDKNKKDGHRYKCKQCQSVDAKFKRKNDPEFQKKEQEKSIKWRLKNPEKYKESKKQSDKLYNIVHKEEIRETKNKYNKSDAGKKSTNKSRKKRRQNPVLKLKDYQRNRLYYALDGKSKSKRTMEIIGCPWEDLKSHLESQFQNGMTWENHGTIWHVDHIIPLGLGKTPEQIYELSHYTNLQPIFVEEHRIKTVLDIKLIKGA